MHLSDEELLALDDGGLTWRTPQALQHLAECHACARRLESWREREVHVSELLHLVDDPAPAVSADQVIARATRSSAARWRPALAAGFALLIIGGAAMAAVPGSFVRRYVERVLASASFPATRTAPARRNASNGPRQDGASGVAFFPTGEVEILFRDAQSAGEMRITLRDSSAVRVAHSGGSAAYALTSTGVMVENVGSGASYVIALPQRETRVVIRVGNRTVFTKTNSHVTTAAVQDGSGAYVLAFNQLSRRKEQ